MFKFIKFAVVIVLVLLVGAVLVFAVGAKMSLDSDFLHTQAAKSLQELSPTSGDALVNISANGMNFRARVAGFDGTQNKPVVILLHGFPVTSAMWIGLINPLAKAGYRVVAFDQRGYSPGARPEEQSAYVIDELTSDVVAIANAIGADQFHLIGHDWGAAVGWATVLTYPERIISWTGLSIAHPAAFGEALLNDPDQQARSGYFAFFQTPWVPETLFGFNDFAMLREAIYSTMSKEQTAEYIHVFSEPGALTAALNWYRAMGAGPGTPDGMSPNVAAPTLFIWGNKDDAVGRAAIDAMAEYIKGPYRNIELDAGHWLMEDEPQRIVREVVQHLGDVSN